MLSIQLGVLGQLLLETRIVLLLIEQSGELAKFRNQVQLLDLLVVLGSKFALVDQQGLLGVGYVEGVSFLIILNEGLGFVVDLNVVHGTLGEIHIGDLVNAEVAVVSDHWLTNDLLLDLTFFPSFLLQIEDVVQDGVLLEATGHEVDLQEKTLLVKVDRGEETLNH